MYDVVGRQVLPMAKHPELMTMPLPKVDVPLPTVRLLATLKLVVVALVPVALAKLSVLTLARVANKSVAVALVVVLLPIDRYCSVDEAREIVPLVKVCSWFHVFAEVVEIRSPVTASRARGSVKYKLVFSVRSRVVAEPETYPPVAFNTPESAPMASWVACSLVKVELAVVEVAVKMEAVTLLSKTPLPATDNFA